MKAIKGIRKFEITVIPFVPFIPVSSSSKKKTPFGLATNERRNVNRLTLSPHVLLSSTLKMAFIKAREIIQELLSF
jgi:hypothetical protein